MDTHPFAGNRYVQLNRRVVQTANTTVLLARNHRLEVV